MGNVIAVNTESTAPAPGRRKADADSPPIWVEAVPSRKFGYSNGGHLVLYLVIEDVTGEPLVEYMKSNVLDPIGMKNNTFDAPLPPRWQARTATAYGADGRAAVPPSKFVEPNLAAGGLWSTTTDLAKFLLEISRSTKANRIRSFTNKPHG
jgi:CubicO group peptidase (beta-lactamase class C family)